MAVKWFIWIDSEPCLLTFRENSMQDIKELNCISTLSSSALMCLMSDAWMLCNSSMSSCLRWKDDTHYMKTNSKLYYSNNDGKIEKIV